SPLWRRDLNGKPTCNACGLYLRLHGVPRPFGNKTDKIKRRSRLSNQAMQADISCANCETTKTSLWRRDDQGRSICNACGLYYRLHRINRVVTVKNAEIKRRNR
ncbi:iron transporter biosynthesis regulating transcription factor, partial [Chytriomyces sp. MP71]